MRFDVLTLFPGIFDGFLNESLLSGAIKSNRIEIYLHNIRDWATDRHGTIDDAPFGGGAGMVMKVDRVVPCVEEIQGRTTPKGRLVLLSPQGRKLTQRVIEELAGQERILLLCGRYEGFDQRVCDLLAPDEISLGDFILNGGEVAAMAVIEATARLLPGVLGDEESARFDSFSSGNRILEEPQFTRPREFRGLSVPEILLSGNHQEVDRWRAEERLKRTRERRPDLLISENAETEIVPKKKDRSRPKPSKRGVPSPEGSPPDREDAEEKAETNAKDNLAEEN